MNTRRNIPYAVGLRCRAAKTTVVLPLAVARCAKRPLFAIRRSRATSNDARFVSQTCVERPTIRALPCRASVYFQTTVIWLAGRPQPDQRPSNRVMRTRALSNDGQVGSRFCKIRQNTPDLSKRSAVASSPTIRSAWECGEASVSETPFIAKLLRLDEDVTAALPSDSRFP